MILRSDGPLKPDPRAQVKSIPSELLLIELINKRMICSDSLHPPHALGIQSTSAYRSVVAAISQPAENAFPIRGL